MVKKYIPKIGDIVSLNFDPQSGHEQSGFRPALVISSSQFNTKTNLSMVCPITLKNNKFIFHVPLIKKQKTQGFILVEHVKSLDVISSNIKYIEKCNKTTMKDVQHLVKIIFNFL